MCLCVGGVVLMHIVYLSLSLSLSLSVSVSVCMCLCVGGTVLVHGDQVWSSRLSSTSSTARHHQPCRLHTQRERLPTQTQDPLLQPHQFVSRCLFTFRVDDAKCIVVTRVCLCVCLSVCLSAAACAHYCTDPDVTWELGRVVGYAP